MYGVRKEPLSIPLSSGSTKASEGGALSTLICFE